MTVWDIFSHTHSASFAKREASNATNAFWANHLQLRPGQNDMSVSGSQSLARQTDFRCNYRSKHGAHTRSASTALQCWSGNDDNKDKNAYINSHDNTEMEPARICFQYTQPISSHFTVERPDKLAPFWRAGKKTGDWILANDRITWTLACLFLISFIIDEYFRRNPQPESEPRWKNRDSCQYVSLPHVPTSGRTKSATW